MEEKRPQNWAGMRTEGSRGFSEFVIHLKDLEQEPRGKYKNSALGTYFCGGGWRMGWGQGTQGGRGPGFLEQDTEGTNPGEGMRSALDS